MKKLLLTLTLVAAAAGCRSNPYCLNCKDSGNGVITPEDMTPEPAGDDMFGQSLGPDMVGSGGPCAPTNGGVEICDGLDNDCNGKIDDVSPDRLIGDPKNCGMCGNECKFPHAFGKCVGGFDGGTPMCVESGCQPGYVDLDGNPANGCEYVCTPTMPAIEVCDGKDNNCDGQVDEGFTTNWADAAHQMPLYDSSLANCGQCGTVCNLGPGTVMQCTGTGTGGRGQCSVKACFNGNDSNGVHQTYRHNPATGAINSTGCEYHCPKAATQSGVDCNPNGACTFPAEVCNGVDDDCNFLVDDNPTDPQLNPPGQACPDGMTGKLCTNGVTCGKGACVPGTVQCNGGSVQCVGSVGPQAEQCNGLDDDCDGQVDQPFTTNYNDAQHQKPQYDKDTNNCGGCTTSMKSYKCALPNAINSCRVLAGETLASCAVAACNPNFYYLPASSSPCTVPNMGPENSCAQCSGTGGPVTGVGCWYSCTATGGEICDGKDNDCNYCVDDGLTAPNICSDIGSCHNNHSVACQVVSAGPPATYGWKCTYGPGVDVDANGNLLANELECDNVDNNCNGPCDESFPDVPVLAINGCTNAPKSAKSCSGGQGVCAQSGAYACTANKLAEQCQTSGGVAIGPNGDLTKATDEKCNGKDDDCNGLVDESTDYTVSGMTFKGWHDPMVAISSGGGTVYVYTYEASRPDATALTPGSSSSRSCSNPNVLPWVNVTETQAAAACASIKNSAGNPMRLCTAAEWTQACSGTTNTAVSHWSMSASQTTYAPQICNDAQEQEQRCKPAVTCAKTCNAQNLCTCTADVDCGGAVGSCDTSSGTCTNEVCPSTNKQCLKTCNAAGQCTCSLDSDCGAGFTCNGTVCVGSGAWPTGSYGSLSVANSNRCYTPEPLGGRGYDFTGNVQEWTSTPVAVKSGTAASIAATGTAGQWQVNGLTNASGTGVMLPSDVGLQLILSGAASANNNGSFIIISWVSSSAVIIANANGVAQSTATVKWEVDYYKLRGGNFSTTASGGDTCEFDFDINRASFVNTNVGFRCCSDAAP